MQKKLMFDIILICQLQNQLKKAMRQNKKRRQENIRRIDAFRNAVKQIKKLIAENKKEEAIKLLPMVYKSLDKATKTGVIKKNTASRKKSRLMKLIQSTPANPPTGEEGTAANDKSKDLS